MLLFKDLGQMDFLAALALQKQLVERKWREPSTDVLLFVEHPHVYTLGRGGDASNVLAPGGIPVYRTSRGGDVTYHGPGQLVAYPIVDLRSKLRKDVHRYVRSLESAAIYTLRDLGLTATRRPPFTGIWIGDNKIAAIGVAVRRCITFHGLALNVNPDLSYFARIIPCGLAWAGVTSMTHELGKTPNMELVRDSFLHNFAKVFGYSDVKEGPFAEDREWRMEDRDPRPSTLDPRLV
jgi:lipoyl(octanoyl) transferase